MKKITFLLSALLIAIASSATPQRVLPTIKAEKANLNNIAVQKAPAATADDEVWVSRGNVFFTDDLLSSIFGLEGAPLTYEVEIQEAEGKSGYFRLVDPFGAGTPFENYFTTGEPTYMIIDATNPDDVSVPLYTSNTVCGNYGNPSFVDAKSYDLSTDNIVYKDNEISFPYRSVLVGLGNQFYYANNNSATKIAFPDNDAHPESVSLNASSATLAEGLVFLLTETIQPATTPYKDVTWSSDNESIATVDGGLVKAIAPGQATITVTTVDGNHTASAIITVDDFKSLGTGKFTDGFLTTYGLINSITEISQPTEIDVEIQESTSRAGFYRVVKPYGAANTQLAGLITAEENHFFYIDATDPESIIIPDIEIPVKVDPTFCNVTLSCLGYDSYFGSIEKNVITFPERALLVSGITENCEGFYYANYNSTFKVVIPDTEKPAITDITIEYVGATKAILVPQAADNVSDLEALLFTVKNDDAVLVENSTLVDGNLTVTDLTKSTTYALSVIAIDEAGNQSDVFNLTFETAENDDMVKPVLTNATLQSVTSHEAVIEVEASDNVTEKANLLYVVTITYETEERVVARVEKLNETDGTITLTGLHSERTYNVTIEAEDEAGNRSESVNLEITTGELQPITLEVTNIDANSRYYENYGVYVLNLYANNSTYTPDVYFYITTGSLNKLSGKYSMSDGSMLMASVIASANAEEVEAESAEVKVELVDFYYYASQNAYFGIYNITFSMVTTDDNLYVGTINNAVAVTYNSTSSEYISVSDEPGFPDIIAPKLTKVEIVEGTLTADSVVVNLDAIDETTEKTALEVIILSNGETFNDESHPNGFRLDEDGNITLRGLTPETEYTLTFSVKDEAGNQSESISISFTTPAKDVTNGLNEVTVDGNNTLFNVLGQKVDANYKGIVIQNGKKVLVR